MKTRLSDYQLASDAVDALVSQLERHGQTAMGESKKVTIERSRRVIESSL